MYNTMKILVLENAQIVEGLKPINMNKSSKIWLYDSSMKTSLNDIKLILGIWKTISSYITFFSLGVEMIYTNVKISICHEIWFWYEYKFMWSLVWILVQNYVNLKFKWIKYKLTNSCTNYVNMRFQWSFAH